MHVGKPNCLHNMLVLHATYSTNHDYTFNISILVLKNLFPSPFAMSVSRVLFS